MRFACFLTGRKKAFRIPFLFENKTKEGGGEFFFKLPEGFLITFFCAGMGAFSTRLSTRWLIKPKYKK